MPALECSSKDDLNFPQFLQDFGAEFNEVNIEYIVTRVSDDFQDTDNLFYLQ